MTTHTLLADHAALWRVLIVSPSGHVEIVEVRSPSAAMALATVQGWKPYHLVATDSGGHPLIRSGLGGSPLGGRIGGRLRGVVEQVRIVGRPQAP